MCQLSAQSLSVIPKPINRIKQENICLERLCYVVHVFSKKKLNCSAEHVIICHKSKKQELEML